MLLREIKNIFHQELNPLYGEQEVTSFFYLLIEHYLDLERFVLAVQPNLALSKTEEQPLFDGLSQLKQQKPIQHIMGCTAFMDLQFKVGPEVLIPRPETEELVRWILKDCKAKPQERLQILDMGTGSGCIPISLAKYLESAVVHGLDISLDALKVARSNAELNSVAVDFFQADMLQLKIQSNYDIIVSNPPYVRDLEKNKMHSNVLDYEPEMALFVSDKDPLVFYRAIANFAKENLSKSGLLYLEINQYLGQEMVQLLEEHKFKHITLRKDMFGNDRMIKGVVSG